MQETLKQRLKKCWDHVQQPKGKGGSKWVEGWVNAFEGQLLIVAMQIQETSECDQVLHQIVDKVLEKNKLWKGIQKEKADFLTALTFLVRKP